MKVDLTHPETNVAVLEIEAGSEKVSQARQAVYRKLVGRFSIPGFRRGKAPLAIVERFVGSAAFDQEVLEELISELYPQAIEETGVDPVSQPEFDLIQWEPREALRFTAKITTKPVVVLGQYTGHEIPKDSAEVSDEAVEGELEQIRQAFSQLVEVSTDETLAAGSIAVIDFTGYIDGEAFEGGASEDYPLELGSGAFIPGFEDALVGQTVGAELDVNVTFPEEYTPELAGKQAVFKVVVKAHRRRELPELNSEFATKAAPMVGVRAEGTEISMETLRAYLRSRLEITARRRVHEECEERVIAKVAGLAEMEVPQVLVDRAAEARLLDYGQMLQRSGSSLEQYLAERELTAEELRERLNPGALETVRRELVLEQIAKQEGIVATDQEVDERVATYAQLRSEDLAEVRARLLADEGFERIRDEIARRKTIDFLVGAQVEVPATEAVDTPDAPASVQLEQDNIPDPGASDAAAEAAAADKPEAN